MNRGHKRVRSDCWWRCPPLLVWRDRHWSRSTPNQPPPFARAKGLRNGMPSKYRAALHPLVGHLLIVWPKGIHPRLRVGMVHRLARQC